eukprot:3233801-Pyramimonas_sp.AAC.1
MAPIRVHRNRMARERGRGEVATGGDGDYRGTEPNVEFRRLAKTKKTWPRRRGIKGGPEDKRRRNGNNEQQTANELSSRIQKWQLFWGPMEIHGHRRAQKHTMNQRGKGDCHARQARTTTNTRRY